MLRGEITKVMNVIKIFWENVMESNLFKLDLSSVQIVFKHELIHSNCNSKLSFSIFAKSVNSQYSNVIFLADFQICWKCYLDYALIS